MGPCETELLTAWSLGVGKPDAGTAWADALGAEVAVGAAWLPRRARAFQVVVAFEDEAGGRWGGEEGGGRREDFEGIAWAFTVLCSRACPIPFYGECGQYTGTPNWCGGVPIGGERDGREGRNGGGVPLGTSCAVSREEVCECGWVVLGV